MEKKFDSYVNNVWMKFSRAKCEDRVDVSKHVIEMNGMSDELIYHEKNRGEKIIVSTIIIFTS